MKLNKNDLDSWSQQEAKLYDIPILIDALPENSESVAHELMSEVVYSSQVGVAEAVTFYEQEMERFGWNVLASFLTNEALLIFDKPSKICSVSIRPGKQCVRVLVFVKLK